MRFQFSLFKRITVAMALVVPLFSSAASNEIVIGQVIDLSSPNAAIGRDYVAGIRTYVDSINTSGGLNGKRINYIVKDDQAQPALAVKEANELIERDQIDYLIGGVGDIVTEAVLASPVFKRSGLVLYAPLASISKEDSASVLFWRPNYEKEIRFLLSHFRSLGVKEAGVLLQDSAANLQAYTSLLKEMQQHGINVTVTVKTGPKGDISASETLRMANAKPGFVFVVADTIGTALFLKEFRKVAPSIYVVGTSLTHFATLRDLAGAPALDWTVFSQVVPNPHKATTSLQMEHSKMMKKFRDEAVSPLTFEGFAVAKALIMTIEVSRNKFVALQDLKSKSRDIDLGGLWITSSPKDNRQSSFLDIALFRKGTGLLF